MRALISWSLGLPLLIILDRAIQGCSVEKRGTKTVLCVQDQCPNLPKVTRKKERMGGPAMCIWEYFPFICYACWKGQSYTLINLELGRGDLTKYPQKTN